MLCIQFFRPLIPARVRAMLKKFLVRLGFMESPNFISDGTNRTTSTEGTEESQITAESSPALKFEATKDTGPLGRTTEAAGQKFETLQYRPDDFYDHFPCFTSAKNISRFISFYECYKKTLGISGHIAEVGVYRGAVSFFFTKLGLLYEPQGLTQVHGFDWFRKPEGDNAPKFPDPASYYEPFERISTVVNVQGLQTHFLLHKLDVLTELEDFFKENDYLRFKIVFLDAGRYDLVAKCINEFWPRLSQGGILILDQFNFEVAPGETLAVRDLLPEDAVIRTFPNGWMPTAYVIKGEKLTA